MFNNTFPSENETINITSVILNNGTSAATSVLVQFYNGECGTGTQINGNVTFTVIPPGQNKTANVTFVASPVGAHNISVCVDPFDTIDELNETNNNLTVVLNVSSTQQFFGSLTGNVTLDNNLNDTEYDWAAIDSGNVYFADIDADVNFNSLQALTRTTTGALATTDCSDADSNLGSLGFNDSVQALWCTDASTPSTTQSFTSFTNTITNVPVINSSNSSDFVTGILWDASDDSGGGQYDTTDNEDLVFVANINRNLNSPKGIVDYIARVPVLLRSYNASIDRVEFFVELR